MWNFAMFEIVTIQEILLELDWLESNFTIESIDIDA